MHGVAFRRHAALAAEHEMVDGERDADGAAGVSRRGLDPQALERPLAQQAAVADAVERDAAGEAQVLHAGLACTCRAMRSMISSVTSCTEAAMSISRCVSGDSGRRGGPPNNASNAPFVMVRPRR